ncbi:MAG TPA: choline/ethanolamine kinase family protein [bacterium]
MTIEEVVARVPAFSGADVTVSALGGGITNLNYKVDVGGESFVVRIPGKDSERLGIDRRREYACTVAASRTGVAPEVTYFLEAEGILITRFIAGRPVSAEELGRPDGIRRVAASLQRVHGGPAFPATFSAFQTVQDYLAVARGAAPLPADIGWMVDRAAAIDRALGGGAVRPCHNDLLQANFIDDGRSLRILDWEYAAMGDPFFDLGNFAVHHGFSDVQETWLLEAYRGQATAADRARVKLMKILSDLREAMWAMVQVAISTLEYDFAAYGRTHFQRYVTQLQDPRLPTWMREAGVETSAQR